LKEWNSEKEMAQIQEHTKNKGGRPKKRVKQDQLLSVKCSRLERVAIETKAKWANLSVSAYLRRMGLTGKIDRHEKGLPREVLQLTGTLNHIAANVNQIAKKMNCKGDLDIVDRATLNVLWEMFQTLAGEIKNHFK
jgi:hypothetical protein